MPSKLDTERSLEAVSFLLVGIAPLLSAARNWVDGACPLRVVNASASCDQIIATLDELIGTVIRKPPLRVGPSADRGCEASDENDSATDFSHLPSSNAECDLDACPEHGLRRKEKEKGLLDAVIFGSA